MVLFEADIAEGALSEVRELMARMVAFNEPDEPETLVYQAFISEDNRRITFMETYSNTEAMLFHDERFTQHFADDLFRLDHKSSPRHLAQCRNNTKPSRLQAVSPWSTAT